MSEIENKRPKARMMVVSEAPAAGAGPEPKLTPQDAPEPGVEPGADAAPPPIGRSPRALLGTWPRIFLWSAGLVISLGFALWVDDVIARLMAASPWLAWPAFAVIGLLVLATLVLGFREIAAIGRLRRIGGLRKRAAKARASGLLRDAEAVCSEIRSLYEGRSPVAAEDGGRRLGRKEWARLADRARDAVDVETRFDLYEREALKPLDDEARAAIRYAARRVATATAIMPSALIDGLAALYFNLSLIRRLAEIYGGRAGVFGSLSLARRVVEHAMAVGLIALGDDLLEPLLGGGVASKVSRRVGEGVVNGAMTARIGIAAMEICRPLPFSALPKPKIRELAWEAVSKR